MNTRTRGMARLLTTQTVLTGLALSPQAGAQDERLEEVVVTGSRIATAESDTTAQPVQYVTRAQLEYSPGESVANLVQSLPINTGGASSSYNDEYNGGNSSMNLRGVGDQYTLVLVNGRRFGGEDTPDIGAIPPEAVEGIEILKTGASAIYGSDAIAGVVNIRLRDEFDGVEVSTQYGASPKGDSETVRVGSTFGFGGENWNFVGSLSYYDTQGFNKYDRDRTASRDYRNQGGLDRRSTFVGSPHRIEVGGQELSLDLSRFGRGQSSTNPADYIPYNFDALAVSTNELGTAPPTERVSGHWSFKADLAGEAAQLYSEGYFDDRNQVFYANDPYAFGLNVPANNPYNPFGEEAFVVYTFNEMGYMTDEYDTLNIQGTLGLRGNIGDYQYDVGYTRYQKSVDESYINDIVPEVAQAAVERTGADALNPFCNACNSGAQLAGLTRRATYETSNELDSFDAVVSGPIASWQAGTIQFAAGYQHREIEYEFDPDQVWQTTSFWWNGGGYEPSSDGRDVDSFFGELNIPLYKADQQDAAVTSADITAAVRKEEYSDYGDSTVWSVLGKVSFLEDSIILRASYGESFRAPTLDALNSPVTENIEAGGFYYDPVRGGFLPVARIYGGNTELDPETGETTSFGVVFRPRQLDNLYVSVDYWDLEITDIIGTPDGQALLDGTSPSGSITRDENDFPTLDLRIDNGGELTASGIDLSATYNFDESPAGIFSFYANVNYLFELEESSGVARVDYLGQFNGTSFGAVPDYRSTAGVNWTYSRFDASLNVDYAPGVDETLITADQERDLTSDDWTTVDFQLGYTLAGGGEFLKGTRLYLGAENIFDEGLPFMATSPDGWDRNIGDLRGRYLYAGFRKHF